MLSTAHVNILRLINQSGPLSRTQLVALCGVSKATMSALTADLLGNGMLVEDEVVYGSGRPAIRLALAPRSAFFIGVSLAKAPFVAVATDVHGTVTDVREIDSGSAPAEVAREIARAVSAMFDEGKVDAGRVAGIGLAIPGLVDAAAGTCVRSTLLNWEDVGIGAMVAEETGLATFIENDANALTLGEHLFGALRGSSGGSLVSVGDGIGCGHIICGDLHRGHHGGAGEIAHATVELDGRPCLCGKRGCLDTLASLRAIAGRARERGLPPSLHELDALAVGGEQEAIAILHDAGRALGLSVSQLIQTLDPQRIVIAFGGIADGLYARVLRQTVESNLMPHQPRRTELILSSFDRSAWAVGAASVAAGKSLFRL